MSHNYRVILTVVFFGLLFSLLAAAQGTFATITGAVIDPQGGAVAGAAITATNTGTNYNYSVQSDEVGLYTLANLLEGT